MTTGDGGRSGSPCSGEHFDLERDESDSVTTTMIDATFY